MIAVALRVFDRAPRLCAQLRGDSRRLCRSRRLHDDLSDHRVNFKAYNLDQVLDGDLDDVIQALVDADSAARMAAVAEPTP